MNTLLRSPAGKPRRRRPTSPQFRLEPPPSSIPAPYAGPPTVDALEDELRALRRENARLRADRHGAYLDQTTGAHDARYFYRRLRQELARTERFDHPTSVVVAEVLPLAELSYVSGRPASNRVLRWVNAVVSRHTRDFDVVARLGTAELGLLLPCSDHDAMLALTARLVRALGDANGRPELPVGLELEVVFGGATAPLDGRTPVEVVMAAEEKKIVDRAIDSIRFGHVAA